MAETDTRYLSEVLTDARDSDLGSWLTKVTVADILPHNPIRNGYLIPLPKTSVLDIQEQAFAEDVAEHSTANGWWAAKVAPFRQSCCGKKKKRSCCTTST